MELLDKLRSNELSLQQLSLDYGIKIREYPDRYVLNYDQSESFVHRFDPIVRECRNLVIARDFSCVLHRSFDRFFNLGEDPEGQQEFIFATARLDEKLDGSLVGAYHDGEKWCFCTRSMAFAEGELEVPLPEVQTFRDVIHRYCDITPILQGGNHAYSYIFELVSPYTRIITPYTETKLVLLAVRNKVTGEYIDRYEEGKKIGWTSYPRTYTFSDANSCVQTFAECKPTFEGYVCHYTTPEGGHIMVKIKNPAYVAMHHLRTDGLTVERIVSLVRAHGEDEYLAYFPEDRPIFEPFIKAHATMYGCIDDTYKRYRDIASQKNFALSIADFPFRDVLFIMRKRNVDALHAFNDLNDKRILALYKLFAAKNVSMI